MVSGAIVVNDRRWSLWSRVLLDTEEITTGVVLTITGSGPMGVRAWGILGDRRSRRVGEVPG